MVKLKYAMALGLAFLILGGASACGGHYRDDVEYVAERAPGRDHFVGSVYFRTSSSALSKAALADIGLMANRIRERRHAAGRVILIGYADKTRGVEENSELAAERAQRVALALEKRGIELERLVIDSRSLKITRSKEGERRVDIYMEYGSGMGRPLNSMYPVLIGLFLLVTFGLAVVIFRRRR